MCSMRKILVTHNQYAVLIQGQGGLQLYRKTRREHPTKKRKSLQHTKLNAAVTTTRVHAPKGTSAGLHMVTVTLWPGAPFVGRKDTLQGTVAIESTVRVSAPDDIPTV